MYEEYRPTVGKPDQCRDEDEHGEKKQQQRRRYDYVEGAFHRQEERRGNRYVELLVDSVTCCAKLLVEMNCPPRILFVARNVRGCD